VAGGLDPAATTARHRTEEGGREREEIVERETKLIQIQIFLKNFF